MFEEDPTFVTDPEPQDRSPSARRKAFRPEIGLALAVLVTIALVLLHDPLTSRRLTLDPQQDGSTYHSYFFGDEGNGGNSLARPVEQRPLAWTCDLRRQYKYGFCGFGLTFDVNADGAGVNLRDFDRVELSLTYAGPGKSLRFSVKNMDERYLAVGAPSAEKVSQMSVPVRHGSQTIPILLQSLAVAEWWRDNAEQPSPELALPDLDNVVAIEVLTGIEAAPGQHRLSIEQIKFSGSAVSTEAWYGGIALGWLLLGAWVLHLRSRERRAWEKRLAETARDTVETIPQMVWSMDPEGRLYLNSRWAEFTGAIAADGAGSDWWSHVHPDELPLVVDAWEDATEAGAGFELECRVKHHSGDYRWVMARAAPARDEHGTVTGWYGTCTDIDDRVTAQRALVESILSEREKSEQLRWTSEHDALTTLPNRRAFQGRLHLSVQHAVETEIQVGLLLIDLDHFKFINDSLGHAAGDALLTGIGARLVAAVRSGDFVARLGGDEFAIIAEGIRSEQDLQHLGDAVLAAIRAPFRLEHRVISPNASIGGAMCPMHAPSADEFQETADAALYALKRSGRGGVRLFQSYMLEHVKRAAIQLTLAREIIAENSILAVYQPQVGMEDGRLTGFEALLRFRSANHELGLPEAIGEAFNDYELAAKLGELMQRRVARDIRCWLDQGIEVSRVAINAAPAEFLRDDYAERLLRVLSQSDISPRLIEVEVTEHVFFDRGPEYVARALSLLRSKGVAVALDDFGTGYSSLSHLRDFAVDRVKIDRSFVAGLTQDQETTALVGGVINLAERMGLEVVAEGVERQDQFKLLRMMGCHIAQGRFCSAELQTADVPGFITGTARVVSVA